MSPLSHESGISGEHTPEVIAENIERTRSEVNATLDALAARLSPSRVLNRAVDRAGERTRRFAHESAAALKKVPWGTVLGVATLLGGVALALRIQRSRKYPLRRFPRLPRRALQAGLPASGAASGRSARPRSSDGRQPGFKSAASHIAAALLETAASQPAGALPRGASVVSLLVQRRYLTGIVGLALGTLLSRVVSSSYRHRQ